MKVSKSDARRDTDTILEMERRWEDHLSVQDQGSYCESPGFEARRSAEILQAIRRVRDLLLNYR